LNTLMIMASVYMCERHSETIQAYINSNTSRTPVFDGEELGYLE
jgi:hypothetical protein